jgi:hypothetical protein
MVQLSFAKAEAPGVVDESPPTHVDVPSDQGDADKEGLAPAAIHAVGADVFDNHLGPLPSLDSVAPAVPTLPSSVQEQLEAEICLPLPTPLIRAGPRLRRSWTPVSIHSLRRSTRITAKPRATNATVQAQKVLLKKLGVEVQEDEPDPDIEEKLKVVFQGDMSENKQRCLQIFLNGRFDVTALDLNLEGLEAEWA